jgi:lipoate-protein ligase A
MRIDKIPRMKFFDFTYTSPAENLACDEWLLDQCEESAEAPEILRFWEPVRPFVVLGYSNRRAVEANLDACSRLNIPVLRRCSGGGTVLQGPGCLNYSLILRIPPSGPLAHIVETTCHIMTRHRQALAALIGKPVEIKGDSDLAINGVKFSGNAQRRKRRALLFHGTFLLNMDVSLMEKALNPPSRQPAYRSGRSHTQFVANLKLPVDGIKAALSTTWKAHVQFPVPPPHRLAVLTEKYLSTPWNSKF